MAETKGSRRTTMSILTNNRILQEGDEYKDNGKWKPIPKKSVGLLVEFAKFKEVRRPSETAKPITPEMQQAIDRHNAAKALPENQPISPDSGRIESSTAKAESEKSPVPTHSGTGDTLPDHTQERDRIIIENIPYDQPMTDEEQAALRREVDRENSAGKVAAEIAKIIAPKGPIEKAVEKAKVRAKAAPEILKIKFPKNDPTYTLNDPPVWTGRNGTFTGYGLEGMRMTDKIMLNPIGKRGVGNCTIQFPVSAIPELIDWLLRQQK